MQGPLGCMRQNRVQSDGDRRRGHDSLGVVVFGAVVFGAVVFGQWSLKRWSLEWWVRTEVFSDRNRNVELEEIFFTSSYCGVKGIFAPEGILAPAKEFGGHISTLLFLYMAGHALH